MKSVVILSGGIDSSTLLAEVLSAGREDVKTLTFNYGSTHAKREIAAAKKIARYYDVSNVVVKLPFMKHLFRSSLLQNAKVIPEGHYEEENMKSTVVPNRNAILLSIAVGYAESLGYDVVWYGAHTGDHAIYPDCREEFVLSFSRAMSFGTYEQIRVLAPYVNLSKVDIVRRGAKMGVPYELTWSCYKGLRKHCGKCGTCVERKEAFQLAGVPDPTTYMR